MQMQQGGPLHRWPCSTHQWLEQHQSAPLLKTILVAPRTSRPDVGVEWEDTVREGRVVRFGSMRAFSAGPAKLLDPCEMAPVASRRKGGKGRLRFLWRETKLWQNDLCLELQLVKAHKAGAWTSHSGHNPRSATQERTAGGSEDISLPTCRHGTAGRNAQGLQMRGQP